MSSTEYAAIDERLSRLRGEIADTAQRHGRDVADVHLIAVSKTRSLAEVRAALSAGQSDFGENTIQDSMRKIPELEDTDACWHFIGHLQSNKCRQLAEHFDWLHSVDSTRLLTRLQQSLAQLQREPLDCLLQVNFSGEASKSGLAPGDVERVITDTLDADLDKIRLRGLMTIGVADDMDVTRRVFSECRELQMSVQSGMGLADFDQLSMGMSGDYLAAIAEGATMVRVGTAIFGPRGTSMKV